jgi:prepilin-type N-terminal cleavage/methylation domain-containing protein
MKTYTKKTGHSGFTLVELIVTLVIIGVVAAAAIMTIAGSMPNIKLDRGVRALFDSMQLGRSKAVSMNRTYRLNILTDRTFKLEWDNAGTWTQDGMVETLPGDIVIPTSPFNYLTNSLTNLQFTSRGLLNVLNSAQLEPFIAVKNINNNQIKTISVNIGGTITIN